MEITGKIIAALPEQSGMGKNTGRPWRKREYVLETQETYPKKVPFAFMNERIDQYPCNVGDLVTLSFDIDGREWQGRWFCEIRAWKLEPAGAAPAAAAPAAQPGVSFGQAPMPGGYPAADIQSAPAPAGGSDDNLPF